MQEFNNPINKKEFINEFGETMILVMSNNAEIWVHHNDCNNDYEKLNIFMLKYVLNSNEQKIIFDFIKECENILDKMIKNLEYPN